MNQISGFIIDIRNRRTFPGIINIENSRIKQIQPADEKTVERQYILPGFIDAHVHIESSMLVPSEFARMAVVHGTVATISDPHEIANVCGTKGIQYMIENGKKVPFKFYFGAPSCVPATSFETAGAIVTPEDIEELFKNPEVKYLAEMMNWPGVLNKDEDVYKKIEIAKKYNRPVDGHAPGLTGEKARDYINAGISTDHECFTLEEALDKLKHGMKILIREGSAAKNFDALIEIIKDYPDMVMFCSDDKHPDSLVEGHIDQLVKRAIRKGYNLYNILQAACINPAEHYNLEVGTLREGDLADFIVIDDINSFRVLKTFINGSLVSENGITKIDRIIPDIINNFSAGLKAPADFKINCTGNKVKVIEALDGQLITNFLEFEAGENNENYSSNPEQDILKITVVNRYNDSEPSIGFIKNFGLKTGAIASSVAHDSHNIIAIGVSDEAICEAVNLLIQSKGGVVAIYEGIHLLLPLPIAGLMSLEDGYKVADNYSAIDKMAISMGSTLQSPFMTLSFMALLVIPSLKLSDKGLFDGEKFQFTSVFHS
jgi:adenine deaminase